MCIDELTPKLITPLAIGQSQLVRVDTTPGFDVIEIRNDNANFVFLRSEMRKYAEQLPSLGEGDILLVCTGGIERFNKQFFCVSDGKLIPALADNRETVFQKVATCFTKIITWFWTKTLIKKIGIGVAVAVMGHFAIMFISLFTDL